MPRASERDCRAYCGTAANAPVVPLADDIVISVLPEISLDSQTTFPYLWKYEKARCTGGIGRSRPGQSARCVSPACAGGTRRHVCGERRQRPKARAEHTHIPL